MDVVALHGEHVRLEPLSLSHVPHLCEAANRSRETYVFTDVPASELAMRRYVELALADRDSGTMLPFATIETTTGRVVGSTRFGNIRFWDWPVGSPRQRGEHLPDVCEIGWTWLAPEAQRTGINTEAKLLMLTLAFETWLVHCVSFRTDARNSRSRAGIERLGARLDGVLRTDKVASDGAIRDSARYSILDSEWPAIKQTLAARLRPSSG